jgi:hypothetical protein
MNYQKFNDNLSLILQIFSFELLLKDCTNNTIMEELQKQDTQYFEKIIKNQEEILKLLKERSE